MTKLKKAWQWIVRNWKWLAGAIGVLIAIVIAIIIKKDKDKIAQLLIETRVLKVKRDISYLEGKKQVIADQEGEVDTEIAEIDRRITELNKVLENNRASIEGLSIEEKLEEFKRLGY